MISLQDAKILIKLARDSIISGYDDKLVEASSEIRKQFAEAQGAFVTLTIEGKLRGCIGYTEAIFPLYETIIRTAKAAAFQDPRFPKLQKEEYSNVEVEISVLTIPELIKVNKPEDYLAQIKIGEDGLIIKGTRGQGLLLPQVFTEHNCTPQTALEMTCQKAGLSNYDWRDLNNNIYKFQAQIFKEEDGKVIKA